MKDLDLESALALGVRQAVNRYADVISPREIQTSESVIHNQTRTHSGCSVDWHRHDCVYICVPAYVSQSPHTEAEDGAEGDLKDCYVSEGSDLCEPRDLLPLTIII